MTSFAPHGFLVKPCTKAVTEPDITSRAILPPNTARPSASSNSAAGDRWANANTPNTAGTTASAAVQTWEEFASAVRCRGSRTSSCHLWTNLRGARFPRGSAEFMESWFEVCAALLKGLSIKNRSGGIAGRNCQRDIRGNGKTVTALFVHKATGYA